MLLPSRLLDVVQVDEATRVSITMRRRQDAPTAQLQRLLYRQVVAVLCIQHTVGKRLAGPNAEQIPRQPRTVRVNVIQRGALLLSDAGAHGAHGQTHPFVLVDQVRQDFGCSRDADAALVPQFVQAALHAQPGQPVLAVGSATGHGAQQVAVDLNHLLHRLTGDPVSRCGSRVRRNDNTALEPERKCRCAVRNLDGASWIGAVVGRGAEPGRRLVGTDLSTSL